MGTRIRNGNEGFSLVELIVAVLILGIISASAIVSFKSVYDAKTDSVTKIVGSVLKQAREKAMGLKLTDSFNSESSGRSDVFAVFYFDESSEKYVGEIYETKYVMKSGVLKPEYDCIYSEKFGTEGVNIVFTYKDSSGSIKASQNVRDTKKYFQVFFKKSTGGVAGMYYADSATDESTSLVAAYGTSKFANSMEISRSGDSENVQKLIIVPATGRCYYDD